MSVWFFCLIGAGIFTGLALLSDDPSLATHVFWPWAGIFTVYTVIHFAATHKERKERRAARAAAKKQKAAQQKKPSRGSTKPSPTPGPGPGVSRPSGWRNSTRLFRSRAREVG